MTDERRQRILQIAEELEAQGLPATNSAVYSRVLGHRGHVVQTLKQRRAERAATGGVLVAEEEPEDEEEPEGETPAVVLAEDVRQLESAYASWHASLEQIWTLEKDGPLDLHTFSRARWLEYQLTENLKQQERLRPQLDQARLREAVHAAQAQHDARLDEARALAEQALQAVATLHDLWEDLGEVFAAQVDGFFAPRDLRGHQAFDVRSGQEYALELFSAFFPNDARAAEAFRLLVGTPLTIGMLRGALANCPRLQPFSARAIATYLNSVTEGVPTNGQHS